MICAGLRVNLPPATGFFATPFHVSKLRDQVVYFGVRIVMQNCLPLHLDGNTCGDGHMLQKHNAAAAIEVSPYLHRRVHERVQSKRLMF